MNVVGIIIGALAGGVLTAMITVMWPKGKLRWLRPFAAAGIGLAAAYFIMTQV